MSTVVFDFGETLVDETTQWSTWASWLGVPPFTLMATLGGLLERGRPFKEVFRLFDPTFDIDEEIERRRTLGDSVPLDRTTLHHDVAPTMDHLASAGYRLYIAGNMTPQERLCLAGLALPVTAVLSHGDLSARNSEAAFFGSLVQRLETATGDMVYVSHRLDTAGLAARQAGVPFLYLQRGPIAHLRLGKPSDRATRWRIVGLDDLPGALDEMNRTGPW
ncbi:HAD family hydrolase [Krasilnikovia sp. M28-CT-15]|uniref:HAD family hydrolase n=1 Tax=Krasilnikovia sp. M28-CT-15 TaxID=3373540 RepID=UPI00399CA0F2